MHTWGSLSKPSSRPSRSVHCRCRQWSCQAKHRRSHCCRSYSRLRSSRRRDGSLRTRCIGPRLCSTRSPSLLTLLASSRHPPGPRSGSCIQRTTHHSWRTRLATCSWEWAWPAPYWEWWVGQAPRSSRLPTITSRCCSRRSIIECLRSRSIFTLCGSSRGSFHCYRVSRCSRSSASPFSRSWSSALSPLSTPRATLSSRHSSLSSKARTRLHHPQLPRQRTPSPWRLPRSGHRTVPQPSLWRAAHQDLIRPRTHQCASWRALPHLQLGDMCGVCLASHPPSAPHSCDRACDCVGSAAHRLPPLVRSSPRHLHGSRDSGWQTH
mmetsp:Transcript_12915/g.29466  ORF Transcript_12915/g.29466 Transcript_12915/m.29466 type:complete len:322 (-) Transcript_12915:1210-2175(-)